MVHHDRESVTGLDPHDSLFGTSDDDLLLADDHEQAAPRPGGSGGRRTRAERREQTRTRRRRRLALVFTGLLVIVVAASAWFVGLPVYRYFHPSDYSGSGSGQVVVTVHTDDDATQIGQTLHDSGVVASVRAFTDAAKKNSDSAGIQPGSYKLRKHMSASNALDLLLSPSSRVNADLVVTEGATIVDVEKRLTGRPCTASSPPGTICGLGLPTATVKKALDNVRALGLPTDFTVGGKVPASAEGFLYPATYAFDDTTGATGALEAMISKFTDEARSTGFTARAKNLGLSPYQELIIASIAQAEAKFPTDMPKVARVIMNRLANHINLQVDATSAYAAKLKGLDPTKTIYSQARGPYNSYNHSGLPPTPISNPGMDAMNGAAHPATGNWLFYVNGDAAGHLYFTRSAGDFARAVAKCKANKWGCG